MSPALATRTDTLLSIENVSLSYEDNIVLRDINAKILDLVRPGCVTGQVVGLLGPSGIGKSTLLRIMAGLNKPTTGSVLLGSNRQPVRPGDVGMVSQDYRVYRHHEVLRNLEIAARHLPDPKQAAVDMLNSFGLLDKAHLYPSQLSGGQRQRLAIGQQILSAGNFLLFDEPTAGLDPLARRNVCHLISEVANRTELETICICSHDIPSIVSTCDEVWLLGRQPEKLGATIVDTIDLVRRGLCWRPDIHRTPEFTSMVEELQDRFSVL